MKQKNPSDEGVDMFHGFWKYFGVSGAFLVGVILFSWGCQILINDWVNVRTQLGPMGNLVLAPLAVGAILAWMSFSEFLRIIRER